MAKDKYTLAEKKIVENIPTECDQCKSKLFYIGRGKYECRECGNIMTDDFGKIRDYLDKNGPSSYLIIAEQTGVSTELIKDFLESGRLELTEDSPYFLTCHKCGCALRCGKFCPDCYRQLALGLKDAFSPDVGDKVKPLPSNNANAKMRFLGRDH